MGWAWLMDSDGDLSIWDSFENAHGAMQLQAKEWGYHEKSCRVEPDYAEYQFITPDGNQWEVTLTCFPVNEPNF